MTLKFRGFGDTAPECVQLEQHAELTNIPYFLETELESPGI